jgi:ADP-heptose:LPS heptosyltransferase
MGPSERGYVDINQKKKDRTLEVLGSIIDKKKTSKFNKTEIKQLEGALRFYKFSQSTDKKGIENWETILANTGSKKKAEPKKVEPRMKGGLISMIMESEGEAKTILENILKKYNSLTEEQKEKNRLALDNKLFDRVISFQRVNSAGDIIGGGIKALKEVQKAIDEMGSK